MKCFSTSIVCAFLTFHIHVTCPAHNNNLLYLTTWTMMAFTVLYWDISMEQRFWEADSHSTSQFPVFYRNRSFIGVFVRAHHWFFSWCRWIQTTPSQLTLILFFHLCLGLPSGIFLSGFPTKFFSEFSIPHTCCMHCPTRHSLIYCRSIIRWREPIRSST
jgi:hypothetical protein